MTKPTTSTTPDSPARSTPNWPSLRGATHAAQNRKALTALSLCVGLMAGCAHSPSPPFATAQTSVEEHSRQNAPAAAPVSMSAEQGALNPQQTHSSFYNSMDAIQACVSVGSARLPVLSGAIEPAVEVDSRGQALRVWAKHSTLGDWETERCIFEALRSVAWPPSQGGPVSIATNRFEFALAAGVEAPAVWDAGKATDPLGPIQDARVQCQMPTRLRPTLTLYVDETGRVLAGGLSTEQPIAPATAECLVEVALQQEFPPAPGTTAKLRFRL